MGIFLYNFFHRETNDKTEKGLVGIPRRTLGNLRKHDSVKRGRLFPPTDLPAATGFFPKQLLSRSRFREVSFERQEIDLQVLANILQCGYGLVEGQRRTVPSLGERYSLGVYLFFFDQIGTCRPGLYWYNVSRHRLELLLLRVFSHYERQLFSSAGWPVETRVFICLTMFFPLSVEGYGSRGYRYGLLEAGHVGQNMLLAAIEAGKKLLPLEGIREEAIEMVLGLNTEEERAVSAWCL